MLIFVTPFFVAFLNRRIRGFAVALLSLSAFWVPMAGAVNVQFQPVAEGVYVHTGELGPRTAANEGLNANIGLVVTPQGAVLIDSGATWVSARQIHAAIKKITPQPVRWIINTGGQDHRWLGNAYFQAQGAEVIAHAQARADMQNRGNDHINVLRAALGPLVDGTVPALPQRWLSKADERLALGGVVFEFRHHGGAHTPGDMLVWLPAVQVIFAGDVVYAERMLGVLPVSNSKHWLATFAEIEKLAPKLIVPGHGKPVPLATAQADTRDYLVALRSHMKKAVDDGLDISEAARTFVSAPFARLVNSADLMPGNASRVYLELERE